jgi:ubiquitin-protein ligase E3 C
MRYIGRYASLVLHRQVAYMLPFLSEPNRRRINLGGSTSAATHASVLDQAKARRQEREALRRQEQCALQIQAWFRGRSDARRAMLRLQQSFDPVKDVPNALRYILLFGRKDPLRLHQISQTILCQPQRACISLLLLCSVITIYIAFLDPLDGPDGVNWVNLLRRLSVIILHDIHHQPR